MQGIPTRLSELPQYLMYILFNPAFNPKAAFLLYASIGLLLLIVLAVGIIFIMRASDVGETSGEQNPVRSEEFEQLAVGEVFEGLDLEPGAGVGRRETPPPRLRKAPALPTGPGTRRVVGAAVSLVLIAAWGVAGYTTSDSAVCKNCHWPAAAHAKAAAGTDRHAGSSCVSCHERGGILGRYLTNVPARLIHFADSRSGISPQLDYGRVTVAACSSCHQTALKGVLADKTRGLKISHKEPLAASAVCVDCHALRGGVVGIHNAGMAPCLRCHDAKRASSQCATCHDEKAALAARVRTTSFVDMQIPDVSCGGCHDEKRECDTCHGMRLPHSAEFKAYAHARAGAVDFWYNGGKGCARCHTATRRSCQTCHGKNLGRAHGTGMTWLARGHQKATSQACDGCHKQFAYMGSRDFCRDICHTPGARAGSIR